MLGRIRGDVTAIKQAEKKLRRSEQRYRILVETMNDSLAVIDQHGLIVYVNDKCSEMLGYTKDELIGRAFIEFFDDFSQNIFKEQFSLRKGGGEGFMKLRFYANPKRSFML